MPEPTPHDLMARMITGYWVSQMVYVAAKIGLADHLAEGPQRADDLAQRTGTHARSLYRLMRALASVGVFSEDAQGRFGLTPLAESLRSDVPGSLRAMAIMMGEEHYRCWGDLLASVRTGEIAFDRLYGKPIFAYLGEQPEQAETFDAAMTSIHGRETQLMLETYDLSGVGVLADIGGGNGTNLIGVLQRYPQMRGVLFDLPHVVARAGATLEHEGLAGRCDPVGGDFFATIPVEADAYLMRHILHDWDDERAGLILRNLRKSMPDGAKLLVVEYVIAPGDQPSMGKLLDLNMLLLPGGVERTEEEFHALFALAGFRLTRVVPTGGDLCVVEGVKGEAS